MSKKKIVIPSQEEVAEYSGQSRGDQPPSGQAGTPETSVGDPPSDLSGTHSQQAGQNRSEAEEYKDKYLRAVAELSNYRKRSEKDREEAVRYANAAFARSLLPVLDNLQRVIASGREHPENTQAILDGAKLTLDSFKKALREHQVEPIEAEGQPFDPTVHEAMMQQPSDGHEVPTVLQVVQEGYKMLDRVIRPSRVIVSASPGHTEETGAGGNE